MTLKTEARSVWDFSEDGTLTFFNLISFQFLFNLECYRNTESVQQLPITCKTQPFNAQIHNINTIAKLNFQFALWFKTKHLESTEMLKDNNFESFAKFQKVKVVTIVKCVSCFVSFNRDRSLKSTIHLFS